MKNYALLLLAVANVSAYSCFAQGGGDHLAVDAKIEDTFMSGAMSNNLVVVAYHVEERINLAFGGSVTTYEVSDLEMISKNDLGKNNTRTITPKYGKAKIIAIPAVQALIAAPASFNPISVPPIPAELTVAKAERAKFVNIDIISTYERILDKGYKSVEMLKKVANEHFYGGDLTEAAKRYQQLFSQTDDLEPEYYYRYAKSLEAIGEHRKAKEMMAVFESRK